MVWRPGEIFPGETCQLRLTRSAFGGRLPKFNGPIPNLAGPGAKVSDMFPALPQQC